MIKFGFLLVVWILLGSFQGPLFSANGQIPPAAFSRVQPHGSKAAPGLLFLSFWVGDTVLITHI